MSQVRHDSIDQWADEMKAMYRQLQSETITFSLPGIFLLGLILMIFSLQSNVSPSGAMIGLGLLLLPTVTWYVLRTSFRAASIILIAGSFAAAWFATIFLQIEPIIFLLILPIGLSALTLGAGWGLFTAGISSMALMFFPESLFPVSQFSRSVTIIGMLGTVGLIWLTLRPLLTAVQWSWSGYQRSQVLLEQSREFQSRQQQAVEDLKNANTQLLRLNQLAQGLRQVAEEERRIKEEFVANVSHELRTPLNMIIGFSSMILKAPETYGENIPPALLADLEIILRNSTHLSSLIDDILDLSQMDAGRMALTRERVDFGRIVEEAAIAVRPLFQSKNLYLRMDVPGNLPQIWCDRTRIREVLLNLLSNAGRFTEVGGITLRAWQEGKNLVTSVADTGIGISETDKNRLFKPFQQLDGSIRRRFGGTGLGLSISKGFVELHDGKMWVESEIGQGTTFYFQLPIEPIAPPPSGPGRWLSPFQPREERDHRPQLPPLTVQPRLVVVEAGNSLGKILSRYFQNVEIIHCTSIEDGLKDLQQTPARALIINDIFYEQQIASLRDSKNLPYGTLLLGCTIPGMEQASSNLGVIGYLIKPISREALIKVIESLPAPLESLLIVDDDPDVRQLFRRVLSSAKPSLRVIRAENGLQALERLRQSRVDVILLDMMMPEMDGLRFLEIKNADPQLRDIPVLLISARDPQGHPILTNAIAVSRSGGISLQQLINTIEALNVILGPFESSGMQLQPKTLPE